MNSGHNGFDVRQGSLKKAIDLRDTCNGFSPGNPLFDPRNANNWIKNKNGELYSGLIVSVNQYIVWISKYSWVEDVISFN